MGDLQRLGAALRGDNGQVWARLRQLTITSISGGLVTGTMAGDTVQVPALEPSYEVGDQVWVAMQGPNPWLVLGSETATAGSAPRGVLGYAERTSAQNTITTETDLTGLSVGVTVGANRRIKITGFLGRIAMSTTGNNWELRIKESTTQLVVVYGQVWANNGLVEAIAQRVLTPSSGSHTYKLTLTAAVSANVEPTATSPAFILVEDIGAA